MPCSPPLPRSTRAAAASPRPGRSTSAACRARRPAPRATSARSNTGRTRLPSSRTSSTTTAVRSPPPRPRSTSASTGPTPRGAPAAGVSGGGRAYSLLTGNAYVVAADAVTGYGYSYSAGCSAVLAEGGATTCTVTVDDIAPTLKVVTVVQNDSGGNAVAADFSAHVRQGGRDVSGSPQAGSGTGTTYTLSSGNFSVSAEGVPGYSATGSGGCAAIKVPSRSLSVTTRPAPSRPTTARRSSESSPRS